MEKLLVLVDQPYPKKNSAPLLLCAYQPDLSHHAFSIFMFDNAERVLLQQRPFDQSPSHACGSLPTVAIHPLVSEQRQHAKSAGTNPPLNGVEP